MMVLLFEAARKSENSGILAIAMDTGVPLCQEIDSIIYSHKERDVIGHFRDIDKDIPIWAVFEVMTLGNFGSFYDCLDDRVKTTIVHDLGMPDNLDSEAFLKDAIFALKILRDMVKYS